LHGAIWRRLGRRPGFRHLLKKSRIQPWRWQPVLRRLPMPLHAGMRPAALLRVDANPNDPFVMALRRIEFESSRLLQAQLLLLKGENLAPFRNAVSATPESRHTGIGKLPSSTLGGIAAARSRRRHGGDHCGRHHQQSASPSNSLRICSPTGLIDFAPSIYGRGNGNPHCDEICSPGW
jgi:hypothetical protein